MIAGSAPAGSELKIRKTFMTATSPVWNDDYGTDIGSDAEVRGHARVRDDDSGSRFEWNVNLSTRPLVAGRDGRDATGPPQADFTFANPTGQPAENMGDPRAGAHEEYWFDVQGPPASTTGR